MNGPKHRANLSNRNPGRPRKSTGTEVSANFEAQIIQHAKRLFMQSGYAAVSISNIVEAVGITKPTLYYYFKDKEALYAAVLCDTLREGGGYIVTGMRKSSTVRDKLMNLTKGFFRNCPTSIAMLIRDATEHVGEENRKQVEEAHYRYIVEPVKKMLEEAMTRREIKQQDPEVLAHMLIGLLDTLIISFTLFYSRKFDYDKMADILVSNFMDGLSLQHS